MVQSKTKSGRPTAVYKATWGDQIPGLMRLGDGRWRISGPDKITFSEADERLAVARFREITSRKPGSIGRVTIHSDYAAAVNEVLKRAEDNGGRFVATIPKLDWNEGKYVVHDETLNDMQWNWVRRQILERPQWTAERLGIEQIGYLKDIPKPTPSPTLEEVGKLYLSKPKITKDWLIKVNLFWREFCECVEVKKLRELKQEHIVDYGDMILGADRTATYARQRFTTVKTVLNYPCKRGRWTEDCTRVHALCKVLVPPQKASADPNPISPEDFRALLQVADVESQALLLISLNCCMYASECAVLNWSDINLDKATVVTDRNKTKVVRIATLWPETLEVIRKLPRTADAIFLTEASTQADYQYVYRKFRIVRNAAHLNKVQFQQIRDGSYTSSVEAGVDLNHCKLLAGHATGISDSYVMRRPQMVAAACDAIRSAYLPIPVMKA